MDFALRCPEVNSGLMYAGPGAGPMLAAAAGWDAVAAGLESATSGYSSVIAGLIAQGWFGPSSMLMAAAAVPYVQWLAATGAQAGQTAAQAYAAAAAYEAAFAMTVPPWVIAANRTRLMALIATNFFGQNTPAIAATQAEYMEMWVQDATAMYGYAAASKSAGALTPFSHPPQTTNQAGQAHQARAAAQSAGNTTRARTQSVAQMTTMQTTQQAGSTGGVDPPLPTGQTANIDPGGAVVHPGVTVDVTQGYPLDWSGNVLVDSGTGITYTENGITSSNAGTFELTGSGQILSGTFTYASAGSGTHSITVPAGESVTGAALVDSVNGVTTQGGYVTYSTTTGLVTDLNLIQAVPSNLPSGFITGPAIVTPVTPSSATPLAAAPAAAPTASSPGLAGTAGIQPQLDAAGLAEWARTVSGADLAADLAGAGLG